MEVEDHHLVQEVAVLVRRLGLVTGAQEVQVREVGIQVGVEGQALEDHFHRHPPASMELQEVAALAVTLEATCRQVDRVALAMVMSLHKMFLTMFTSCLEIQTFVTFKLA